MKTSTGKEYFYPTPNHGNRLIGVAGPLGGAYIVAWRKDSGSLCRVKSPHLPPMDDPAQLQQKLDAWAAARGLEELA